MDSGILEHECEIILVVHIDVFFHAECRIATLTMWPVCAILVNPHTDTSNGLDGVQTVIEQVLPSIVILFIPVFWLASLQTTLARMLMDTLGNTFGFEGPADRKRRKMQKKMKKPR